MVPQVPPQHLSQVMPVPVQPQLIMGQGNPILTAPPPGTTFYGSTFLSLQGRQPSMPMQEEPPTLDMNTLWLLSHLREPKLTTKIQVYLLHGRKPELNMKFEEMAASIYEEYMKLPSLQGGQPDMSMQEELPTLGMNTLWLLSHLREPKYTEKVQVYLLYGRKPTLNMEFEEMAEVINEKYRKEIFPQEEMTIYEFIQNFQDEGATIYECIQNFLDEYKMLQSDMPVEEEQPLGMNTLWLLSHLQKPELTKKVQVQLLYGRKPELNMKFEEIAAFIYEEYMTEIYPQEGKTIYELAQTVLDKFPSLQGGQPGMQWKKNHHILGMKTLWLLSHLRERKYTEKVQVYLLYGRKPELNMEFEEMAAYHL
ncbi:uncharacterized protein [Ptychodera flava]|uniref:uncharacterized protein n=1 Tax=Ptychodera flava TaxID=63121 RepID=UPI003969C4F2